MTRVTIFMTYFLFELLLNQGFFLSYTSKQLNIQLNKNVHRCHVTHNFRKKKTNDIIHGITNYFCFPLDCFTVETRLFVQSDVLKFISSDLLELLKVLGNEHLFFNKELIF